MEWLKPISEVNDDFLRKGVFVLVDMNGSTLKFFCYGKDCAVINQAIDSIKGRGQEMVKFLLARASVKRGETK